MYRAKMTAALVKPEKLKTRPMAPEWRRSNWFRILARGAIATAFPVCLLSTTQENRPMWTKPSISN